MNQSASCYGQKFGHNFPYTGANCLQCGVNQSELSGKLKPVSKTLKGILGTALSERKPPKGIHSELHGLVDELRTEYRETAKVGKGSFGFYLGLLGRISTHDIYRLRAEVKQSDCREPGKLFWWKYRELIKSRRVDSSPPQKCNDNV